MVAPAGGCRASAGGWAPPCAQAFDDAGSEQGRGCHDAERARGTEKHGADYANGADRGTHAEQLAAALEALFIDGLCHAIGGFWVDLGFCVHGYESQRSAQRVRRAARLLVGPMPRQDLLSSPHCVVDRPWERRSQRPTPPRRVYDTFPHCPAPSFGATITGNGEAEMDRRSNPSAMACVSASG